jgi:uncharacterized protein with PQ loop repeat
MTGNCIGWTVYSVLIDKNLFVFFGNVFGFLLSVWLNLCATKLEYQDHHNAEMRRAIVDLLQKGDEKQLNKSQEGQDEGLTDLASNITTQRAPAPATHQNSVMAIVILWTGLISLLALSDFSTNTSAFIVGMVTNAHLLLFYGAPLSTIFTVLNTRNSASIHIGTMLMNTASATFWAIYGLVIFDPFLFVVNGLGTILGAVQIGLYLLLPRIPMGGNSPSSVCADSPSQCISTGVMLTPTEGRSLANDLSQV